MGPFVVKWTHDPSLRRTARKKKRLQTSLNRFCDGDSPSSIVFHFLTQEQDIQATGISAVGYGFVTGGVMILPNVWKEFSRTVKWLYLFLIFLSGLMLLPAITGWISTLLHLSGIVSYLLVFIGSNILKGRAKVPDIVNAR